VIQTQSCNESPKRHETQTLKRDADIFQVVLSILASHWLVVCIFRYLDMKDKRSERPYVQVVTWRPRAFD
jgi:hypothetical protein